MRLEGVIFSGGSRNFERGKDNTPLTFIANGHNELYALYMGKRQNF